jgi:two-component system chemotaxis response regulator CheY
MKHCLVVDDSRVIRKVVCQILEEMKFYAEEAAESASALEACRVQMPDVVLVNLGSSGGIEFVRALRRNQGAKQPVVIGSMIEHDVTQIGDALSAGADEYVLKPFDRECLKTKFAEMGLV